VIANNVVGGCKGQPVSQSMLVFGQSGHSTSRTAVDGDSLRNPFTMRFATDLSALQVGDADDGPESRACVLDECTDWYKNGTKITNRGGEKPCCRNLITMLGHKRSTRQMAEKYEIVCEKGWNRSVGR
jgi:hypothetical protein